MRQVLELPPPQCFHNEQSYMFFDDHKPRRKELIEIAEKTAMAMKHHR